MGPIGFEVDAQCHSALEKCLVLLSALGTDRKVMLDRAQACWDALASEGTLREFDKIKGCFRVSAQSWVSGRRRVM
jgi:adenylosuccinate lyase